MAARDDRPPFALDERQRAAVEAPDGPLLVAAGPGAGKTTVIVERIAHLITARGVPPDAILAVAFSRRSRAELQARLAARLPEHGRRVLATTYHALGRRIILQWPAAAGYRPGRLAVYAGPDAALVAGEALRRLGIAAPPLPPAALADRLARWRLGVTDAADGLPLDLPALAGAYEELLRRRNAIDFAAMVTLPPRILEAHPAGLALLQAAYRHILVDEFQDSCRDQFRLARLLTGAHGNLTVVGDACQCIYGFRGADPRRLDEFAAAFPGACHVALDANYRATAPLVAATNALVADLPYAHPQVAAGGAGPPVVLRRSRDEADEAAWIAGELGRLRAAGELAAWAEAAVLYRAHAQRQPIAAALRAAGIPHRARRPAGDLLAAGAAAEALAYLRLVADPDDVAAWRRVLAEPDHGLRLLAEAIDAAAPVDLAAITALADRLDRALGAAGTGQAAGLRRLLDALAPCRTAAGRVSPALVDAVLDAAGLLDRLRRDRQAAEPLAAIDDLRALADAGGPLDAWLADLLADDLPADGGADAVTLSTVHAAKGLEWAVVFAIGLDDGVLPDARALADPAALRAERHIAYVALTRARRHLYLRHCRRRRGPHGPTAMRPSRFLAQLPPASVAVIDAD
ncbi:MAG: ATP-dependent helicase [Chloroflexi bacterium]|nr:ATP-dependent helicase [Chloroflexota bacterium]